ncbi:ribosome quality control complex subunit TCF25-like [Littorina saxatilis]|uniref:Transcription factor 25 n=1 Tax=Littorina saxatilis TaxID=31220 RepID=A0AAN9C1Q1_9CAEN
MSNRALRRLQQQTNLIPGSGDGSSAEEDEEVAPLASKKKGKKKKQQIVNPFELLTEHADDEENNEDPEEEEEEEEKSVTPGNTDANDANASAEGGKKKKKNKKKKKKAAEASAATPAAEQVEDEIEASIQEVNRILGVVGAGITGAAADATFGGASDFTVNMKALLNVEYKFLNADNEMRRRFGSRVVQAEQGRSRHRNRVPQRQGRLVQPKDNWPVLGRTGVTMSVVEGGVPGNTGEQCFTFEHSKDYQTVQFLFLDAVQSHNPQNIANLVHGHPYHIDSLIQLSEVFHMNEDAQTAVDLIERALYAFEGAFHPRFNMATGNCRLDFKRQENRAFFLALFKHLTAVGQRGCHRTALELCKLLLSLDPDGDPMCALLMIDYYALRAEQYNFLIRLFEEWEAFRNLTQLPNFAFSVPLAMFHLAKDNQTLAQKADDMLEEALLMFPGLLITLLDKCGVNPDKRVADHAFFGLTAQANQKPALQQLVALYVGRCFSLWKEPEALLWLERVVKDTLDLVDAKDARVTSFADKRKVRYQGTPRNIYRHFIISGIKDATATLPPELTNTAVLSYDPLPPLDAVVSYTRPPRPAQPDTGEGYMSLFLRSLLPNFNAQEGANADAMLGAEGGGGEEAEEGGGANHELRRGVGVLMDAMRDLLNNIRMAPPPVENGQDGEGEGGEREGAEGEERGEWD